MARLDSAPSRATRRLDKLARTQAVLSLRRDTMQALAERVGVTAGHLRKVLGGQRGLSSVVNERLFAELGRGAWRFILGEVDELRVEDVA